MLSIDQQMREMLQTPGVRSVCLIDWRGGDTVSRVGEKDRAAESTWILQALHTGPLCTAEAVEDVVVTDDDHHLLLAVLKGSDLCVQVRMERERGNLAFALRRLRGLASTARVLPPRRGPGRDRPVARPAVAVDRAVLERVLEGLRTLSVDHPRTGPVIA
ncbi:hypothetical protein KIK06_24410 [Nocardiopsis sp. EMB25]|uniref:hypothetical protein n=1 Tax=Nocardiopsis TaxID=2013 RepID=UPI00034BFE1B|nr:MULTISPECIES: hypothetical protein [Nocardiopsis]MCY9787031.1 hypothetical protein [Nocardiopsis sp. EMB25]